PEHRAEKLVLRWDGAALAVERRALRPIEDLAAIFFEKDWGRFLAGEITGDGFRHG
ncbi:MAG: hypothetical protein H0W72_15850, partial [Planctomycetes bacterium]|nr:hypothetical protein [Planctomycetota bacterium]